MAKSKRSRALQVVGATLIAALLSLTSLHSELQAQEQSGTANLTGKVVNAEDGEPLDEAIIEIVGTDLGTETSKDGRFWIQRIPAGEQTVVVHYSGAHSDSLSVTLVPGRLTDVQFSVGMSVVPVPALQVVIDRQVDATKLAGFYKRAEGGRGYYVTRDDILDKNPRRTSDMLRQITGFQVSGERPGQRGMRSTRGWGIGQRPGGSDCTIMYFLDGVRAPGYDIDNLSPNSVAGIEVYRGPSSVPAEFRGSHTPCAAVVIWTRDPSAP